MAQTTVPKDIHFYLFIKIYFQSKNIKRTQLSHFSPLLSYITKTWNTASRLRYTTICSLKLFDTYAPILCVLHVDLPRCLCVYACYIKSLIQSYLGNTTFWSKKCLVFCLLLGFLFCFLGFFLAAQKTYCFFSSPVFFAVSH